MPWFAVHAIMRVSFKDGFAGYVPVWENIYLVAAESPEEAHRKGVAKALAAEGDSSGTFFWDDHPASWVFAGVRKIIKCDDDPIEEGVEVTYSQFRLRGEDDLEKLVAGEPVKIVYED
ncbi:DUF4288 domain-containing protein [Archangium violaceum]|uniref:DUF4288 domain-containing protein n=1 Tax=Archangium violaceum TaxID=83451 RepID=UPI0019501A92|nr:DUF4288 domain-containing protein [Archangium violaceum]QRN97401.1 DUF4288 domain-containing protein [Archangium violaceum]